MQQHAERRVGGRIIGLALSCLILGCGGGSTEPPAPPDPGGSTQPPELSDELVESMCVLSQGSARLIGASRQQVSGSLSTGDCEVAGVSDLEETYPGSDGVFESVYVGSERAQRVVFGADAFFDAAMALFEVSETATSGRVVSSRVRRSSGSGSAESLRLVASSDDRAPDDPNPRLTWDLRTGVGYLIVVSGFAASETGAYSLSMGPASEAEPPQPEPGTISVATVTSGDASDPDGYDVVLNGRKSREIGGNGQVLFTSLAPGEYRVELQDVASSCSVNGPNPRDVTVVSGQVAGTTFQVDCSPATRRLSIQAGGDGDGTVVSSPSGISCTITDGATTAGTCSASFTGGIRVSLTARESSGSGETSDFTGWGGDCSGTSCTVTMDQDRTVTASFLQFFELTVRGAGRGSGSVSGGGGISCSVSSGTVSGKCSEFFQSGVNVGLKASPAGSSVFVGWSGDCTGTGGCSVVLDQPRDVTATFALQPGPPTISSPRSSFVSLGQCSSQFPNYNRIRYTVDYTDPDGDIQSSTVQVHVQLAFSNGTSDSYVSAPAFNSVSGDGFQGTVTADNCLLYGSAKWVDVTLRVEDAAGNVSNSVTMRVDKPAGAT